MILACSLPGRGGAAAAMPSMRAITSGPAVQDVQSLGGDPGFDRRVAGRCEAPGCLPQVFQHVDEVDQDRDGDAPPGGLGCGSSPAGGYRRRPARSRSGRGRVTPPASPKTAPVTRLRPAAMSAAYQRRSARGAFLPGPEAMTCSAARGTASTSNTHPSWATSACAPSPRSRAAYRSSSPAGQGPCAAGGRSAPGSIATPLQSHDIASGPAGFSRPCRSCRAASAG